jgi:hypothetical protein
MNFGGTGPFQEEGRPALRDKDETGYIMSDVLWAHDATTLASLIRDRQVSVVEVVQTHLDRVDAVNPRLNAVTVALADTAIQQAAAADKALAAGLSVGPLHGVPFTVKENIDVAGTATTWGVPALAGAIAAANAPVVERMRNAGAIPIGRTNLPDMAVRAHTESALHGLTRTLFRLPSGRMRGRRKHVSPSGRCASTRNRSFIGAKARGSSCPVDRVARRRTARRNRRIPRPPTYWPRSAARSRPTVDPAR